ncbi:MAG: peptidase M6, partial [Nitrospinota bacterium]
MRKQLSLLLLVVLVTIWLNGEVYAISASPELIDLTQADGTTFKARKWGDELLHGWETVDGYTIIFDEVLGSWVYAVNGSDGSLFSS